MEQIDPARLRYIQRLVKDGRFRSNQKWYHSLAWQKLIRKYKKEHARLIIRMPKQYLGILRYLGNQQLVKQDKFNMVRKIIMGYYELLIRTHVERNNKSIEK